MTGFPSLRSRFGAPFAGAVTAWVRRDGGGPHPQQKGRPLLRTPLEKAAA